MSSWAKPGVKCVCIDNTYRGSGHPGESSAIQVGKVYEVKDVFTTRQGLAVSLVGVNTISQGFRVSRFRPLITKTQEEDVVMFRHLLNSTPAGVDA